MTDEPTIALAFPLHEGDRAKVRAVAKQPLPAIYPDSVALPCAQCGMVLAVGPRTAEQLRTYPALTLLCPFCIGRVAVADGAVPEVRSLGNPDSHFDEPTPNPDLCYAVHGEMYCTLPSGHDGPEHIATIGPYAADGVELARWPMTRRYWLSFCDGDKPEGQQFLGVCIIDVSFAEAASVLPKLKRQFPNHQPGAEWIAAASTKAWALGCNPGGSVATMDITDVPPPEGLEVPLNTLMDRAELKKRGLA